MSRLLNFIIKNMNDLKNNKHVNRLDYYKTIPSKYCVFTFNIGNFTYNHNYILINDTMIVHYESTIYYDKLIRCIIFSQDLKKCMLYDKLNKTIFYIKNKKIIYKIYENKKLFNIKSKDEYENLTHKEYKYNKSSCITMVIYYFNYRRKTYIFDYRYKYDYIYIYKYYYFKELNKYIYINKLFILFI